MERCIYCKKTEYMTPILLVKSAGARRGICFECLKRKLSEIKADESEAQEILRSFGVRDESKDKNNKREEIRRRAIKD